MAAKDALGRYGERLVAARLTADGWQVLDRNWRGTRGELDLVALEGRDLVVVEVKTRSGDGFGHPAEAVTAAKLARLRRLAGEWLAEHDVRVDGDPGRRRGGAQRPGGDARVEHLRGVL